MMLSRGRRWLEHVPGQVWVAFCLLALVLLFFWRFLTPKMEDRVAFPGGDFTDQFYAWRLYEARELSVGRLPLWSPYYNSGHPFLADPQAAVFYPVGLTVTLLASRCGDLPVSALQYEAFLHFFLAGLFTYLFVLRLLRRASPGPHPSGRDLGASPHTGQLGALVAGITFAFGGYLTSYPPLQLAVLETVTWLPLWLLALDMAAERGSLLAGMLAGAVLCVAALAGHTQTLLFMVYAGVAYYAYRCWASGGKSHLSGRLRQTAGLAFILGFGFTLAAVQWVPSLEYASLSTRSSLTFNEASSGMPPLQMVQILLPGAVSAFSSPLYVGILPLWLSVTGLAARRNRHVAFWAVLAVVALLDMLGGFSFFYNLLYLAAPGFALFRGQERAASIFSFAFAVLAGYGADSFGHWLPRPQKAAFMGSLRILAWSPLAGLVLTLAYFYATRILSNPGSFIFLVDRAALMTLICILCYGLAAARLWGRLRPWHTRSLVVLLVVFDLFTINWYNNQSPVRDRFAVTPLIQSVQSDGTIFRIDGDALPGHAGVVYGLEDIRGISPLRIRSYDDLLSRLPKERLWSLLNVRYLVTADQTPPAAAQLVIKDGEKSLFRLAEPLPRAWLVGDFVLEPDPAKTLALLASPAVDPGRTAILADPPARTPSPQANGNVQITAHGPDHVTISASADADAILVVSEVYYPGWSATVDGQATPILRADDALRAVFLPAGNHVVEMVYEATSLRLGAAASLLAVLALVITLALALRSSGQTRRGGRT